MRLSGAGRDNAEALLGIDPDPAEFARYSMEHHSRKEKLDEFIHEQQTLVLKQHRKQTAECLLLSRDPKELADPDSNTNRPR